MAGCAFMGYLKHGGKWIAEMKWFTSLDYYDQAIVVLSAALALTFTVIVAAEARRMWKKRIKRINPLTDEPEALRKLRN